MRDTNPRPGSSDVKVVVAPPYGRPYTRTVEEVAEIFEVPVRTVVQWCNGERNVPYRYKVGYADGYEKGMSDKHWRAPLSKEAKTMYEAMKERRRRELGE